MSAARKKNSEPPAFAIGDIVIVKNKEYLTAHRHEYPSCTQYMIQHYAGEVCVVEDNDGGVFRIRKIHGNENQIFIWAESWLEHMSDGVSVSDEQLLDFLD